MGKGCICGADAGSSAVPVFEERAKRIGRWTLTRVLRDGFQRFITQGAQEVRFHVSQASRWEERIEHGLHLQVAHSAKEVSNRRADVPQGLQHLLSLRQGSAVASHNSKDDDAIGSRERSGLDNQFVGASLREFTEKAHPLFRLCYRMEYRASQHGTDFVQTVFQRGGDSEVTAAAPHAPEEVWVF